MVCHQKVWCHLLSGVTKFLGERLDELVKFGVEGHLKFGVDPSSDMMIEVVKGVASRC